MSRKGLLLGVVLSAIGVHSAFARPLEDFCKAERLEISPNGDYVFARRSGHVRVARTDCLASAAADCEVTEIWNPAPLGRGVAHFAEDDRFLYTYGMTVDEKGRSTGQGMVYKIDVGQALRGQGQGQGKTTADQFPLPAGFDVLAEIDVEPPKGGDAGEYWASVKARLDIAGPRKSKLSYNVRNLYGRISDKSFVYLYRRDEDYSVVYGRGGKERPLWPNGNAFEERTRNLDFRFDGDDVVVLAQGGVLRIGQGAPRDLTKGRSRAALIQGDDPAGYYGYWTAEGAVLNDVSPALREQLSASLDAAPLAEVSGVSVNNRTGAFVVSTGPGLIEDEKGRRSSYRHVYVRDGVRREIDCGGPIPAAHQVVRVGGDDYLFVERYQRPGAKATVLFLYGGPQQYVNLAAGLPDRILTFLDSGLNVDVIHYGGSGYTFDLSNRLLLKGPTSIDDDAAAIEAYVAATYPEGQAVSLYANSFGALFYRHFNQAFLDRLDRRVLDAPGGSVGMREEPIWKAINEQGWGRGTMERENRFFAELTACPLKAPTTIVIGRNDTTVNAREDYRLCGAGQARFVEHPYDHMQNPLMVIGGRQHSVILLLARELGGAPPEDQPQQASEAPR